LCHLADIETVEVRALNDVRQNAILARLPDDELERVSGRLEVVDVEVRTQVYEPGSTIREVYFPLSSVFSLVAVAEEQVVVEVATIGREGFVGLPVFLGARSSPHASFCQIPGRAARMEVDDLRRSLTFDGALHTLLNRFTEATMVQVAQNVVCNNAHSVEQRAARWLLTTQDRLGSPQFPLTQEFLAQMLGVRRPTVSETASRLQARGLIRYSRGVLSILDRAALEATACSCYEVIRSEFRSITGD
jgi:CRP-like cAMP-binding protein